MNVAQKGSVTPGPQTPRAVLMAITLFHKSVKSLGGTLALFFFVCLFFPIVVIVFFDLSASFVVVPINGHWETSG